MKFTTKHTIAASSVFAVVMFIAITAFFSQVSFNASANKTALLVDGKVSGCYTADDLGIDEISCELGGSSFCKKDGGTPQCVDAALISARNGATILDCDMCGWIQAGCTDDDYTTNCRYSSCTRDGGTKTCDKDSDAPSTCATLTRSWTSGITCPTDCTSSTQTFSYTYTCTTDGKKTKVYTSSAGTCRPSANEVEECDVCNDTVGANDAYTSCPWPQTCSAAQQTAGKAVVDCTVPSGTRCKPTNSGSTTFNSTAKRSREKSCCTISDDYTRTCSQNVSSCPSGSRCDGGKIVEITSSLVPPNYTAPSFRYSASKSSSRDCIALPSETLETSCCSANVKSCTTWQCTRNGASGIDTRTCKPYTCSNNSFTAGSPASESGNSCSTYACTADDYEVKKSVKTACPTSGPNDGKVEIFGNKKKASCVGNDWTNEESFSCCTQNSWACSYSPDCSNSNGGTTITQTCTNISCNYSPPSVANAASYSGGATVNNGAVAKPSPIPSKYCADENSSQKGGVLPDGADGNTLRFVSGGWSSNSFLKNTGAKIGVGTVADPSSLLEISNASTASATTQVRITDTSNNPELQLQYAVDSQFASNQHWAVYVQNKKSDGSTGDNSLRIWGLGEDRVIIGQDGAIHAKKFCTNTDTTATCTEITGGGGGESLWTKNATTNEISYDAAAVKIGSLNGLGIIGGTSSSSPKPYTFFKGSANQAININYTLPATIGADGQFLKLGASGALSWSDTGAPDLARYSFNNLLQNGGFEGGPASWGSKVVTEYAHSGRYSYKRLGSSSDGGEYFELVIPVKKNTRYSYSLWVKAENISGSAGAAGISRCTGTLTSTCNHTVGDGDINFDNTTTYDWKQFVEKNIDSQNSAYIRITVFASNTSGSIYIDDIMFVEGPSIIGFDEHHLGDSGNQYILGNLGIGTTAPEKLLHLKTTQTGSGETIAAENAELTIQSGNKGKWGIYHDFASEDLRFWNSADQLNITKTGVVILGKNPVSVPPEWRLAVLGDPINPLTTTVNSTLRKYCQFGYVFVDDNGNGQYDDNECKSTPFVVEKSGNVGIGTTNPVERLEIRDGKVLVIDPRAVLHPSVYEGSFNTVFADSGIGLHIVNSNTTGTSINSHAFLSADMSTVYLGGTLRNVLASPTGKQVAISKYAKDNTLAITNTGNVVISTGLLTLGEDKASGTANTPGALKIFSAGDDALSTSFVAGTQTANAEYTLPLASTNGILRNTSGALSWDASAYVTSVTTGNGVSATNTAGALAFTLGAITPTSVNGLTLSSLATGFSIAGGGTTSKTLTVSGDATVSGTNTGDQDLSGYGLKSGKLNQFAATTSAELAGVITDEIGSGVLVFGTAPTFTTSIFAPLILGGATADNALTLQGNNATTGNTPTSPNIQFKVGDNGSVVAMTILNSGNVGIGTAAPSANYKLDVAGSIKASGLQLTTNPGSRKVLTSDATGIATWQDPQSGGSENMVTNPSFELGTMGYTSTINTCVDFDTAEDRSQYGAHVGRVIVKSATPCNTYSILIGIQQEIQLSMATPGKSFVASAWVKAPSGRSVSIELKAGFGPSAGTRYSQQQAITTNGSWQKVIVVYSIPTTTEALNDQTVRELRANIGFVASTIQSGDVLLIDGLQVEEGTQATSLKSLTVHGENSGALRPFDKLFLFDGNVGIRTAYPSAALDVQGVIHASDKIAIGGTNSGNTIPRSMLHIFGGQDFGTDLSLDATGVGSGTTQGHRWQLISTAGTASEGAGKFLIKDAGTGSTANNVRLTIDSAGHVGIGKVTNDELETSKLVIKSDDENGGFHVSFQGNDTTISTTPYPVNESRLFVSLQKMGVGLVQGGSGIEIVGTKKNQVKLTYFVQNTGTRPLKDITIVDTNCNGGNPINPSKNGDDITGDTAPKGILNALPNMGPIATAGVTPLTITMSESWEFTCTTGELSVDIASSKVTATGYRDTDTGKITKIEATTGWKATFISLGNPYGGILTPSGTEQRGVTPAAQPISLFETTLRNAIPSKDTIPSAITNAKAIIPQTAWGSLASYVTITWMNSPNATKYEVYRITENKPSGILLPYHQSPMNDDPGPIRDLAKIKYKIVAINAFGKSEVTIPLELGQKAGSAVGSRLSDPAAPAKAAPGPIPIDTPAAPEPANIPVPPKQTTPTSAATQPSSAAPEPVTTAPVPPTQTAPTSSTAPTRGKRGGASSGRAGDLPWTPP